MMVLNGGVINWLETNRFKVYGALNNVWMNDEGFVLLALELRHEQPSSLDHLLATLRRGKAAHSKPAYAPLVAKVLIVDDDPSFRRALRDTLESDDHEVIGEAENGEEALEMLERCKPDVILLDLSMPRMNGWEVLRMLRDGGKPFPPVIVVSTLNVGDDSLPFFAEIQKGSIDSQHLLSTISAALTASSPAAPRRRRARQR